MKILDYIICDDIRREFGGKHTIVGAYNDRIDFLAFGTQPLRWPINKQIGIYIRFKKEDSDPSFDKFKLNIDVGMNKLAFIEGVFPIDNKSKTIVLDCVLPVVQFQGPGTMTTKIEFLMAEKVVLEVSPELNFTIGEKHQSLS